MGKTVRKYRFIEGHRIGETESWLTDMAARGLHLESVGYMFARFKRGEPENVRYRVDFTYKPPEGSLQRMLYEDSGWEYVCSQNDVRIYRSPEDADAPEPHTDPAEQAYTLTRLRRKLTSTGILTVLLYAAASCMVGFSLFIGSTPVLNFVEGSMSNLPFIILLYIYGGAYAVESAVSVRRLIRSLREGRAINHRANWKRLYRTRVTIMIILIAIAPFVVALPFVSIAMYSIEELPPENDVQMIIRLADIENEPTLRRKTVFRFDGIDYSNSITRKWSPYADMLETSESSVVPGRMWPDGSGEYSPSLDHQIYRLRIGWMAGGVIDDLCRKYERYSLEPVIDETGRPGFDRLYIGDGEYGCVLFASRGGTVIRLHYYGEQDIEVVIAALARLLNS